MYYTGRGHYNYFRILQWCNIMENGKMLSYLAGSKGAKGSNKGVSSFARNSVTSCVVMLVMFHFR